MRALPVPVSNPGTGRKLPTPAVTKKVVQQEVDMKPQGNTVAVTTVSDNPFERKGVTVVTQASGGYPGVPSSMQSRGLMHSFMPGLGKEPQNVKTADDGKKKEEKDWQDALSTLTSATTDIFSSVEGRRAAGYEARIAEARAQEAAAEAEAEIARSRRAALVDATSVDTGLGFKVNVPLILLGVGLLGGAYFLSRKRKK